MTKNYRYDVIYEKAPEGGYVGYVPALPGCHTQGETIEETEKNVKEAIDLYLETMEDAIFEEPMESYHGLVEVAVKR